MRTGSWQPSVGMGAGKAALEALVRYFAVALARRGITVNADGGALLMDTVLPLAIQGISSAADGE